VSLAEKIREKWSERIRSKIRTDAHPTNRASMLGDVCLRRLVLWRTSGHLAAPPSETLQSIFELGNMVEASVRRTLSEVGIELIESQRGFPANAYGITGHIDGIVEHDGRRYVAEIKSLNGTDWQRIDTAADIQHAVKSWLRKWYGQMQVYILLSDVPAGVFLLFNKATGELKVVEVEADYDEGQRLLDRAEAVNGHVKAGTLPAFIQDAAECRRCAFFGRACDPPVEHGEGAVLITDPALIEVLEEWGETADAAERHEAADKRLKEALRGVEQGLAGEWVITGRWMPFTRYPVPPEVRAQYKTVDPKGAFRLSIERVTP